MTLIKTCSRCHETKSIDQFSTDRRNKKTGKQHKCKACDKAYELKNSERISKRAKLYRQNNAEAKKTRDAEYRANHKGEASAYMKIYYAENKEKLSARRKQHYIMNKKKIADQCREYSKNNRGLIRKINKERKIKIKQAIPKWANHDSIKKIYDLAVKMSSEHGIPYHVDHIVPIKSKYVCGLHCEDNLQILTGPENCSKSNHYWPDMPKKPTRQSNG